MNAGPSFSAGAFKLYCSVGSEDGISCHKPVTEFQLFVEVAANNSFPYWAPIVCLSDQLLSHVWFFATPGTGASQAPLSMGLSRQEYCSGLLSSPPGDLSDPGIEPTSLMSPVLAGGFFTTTAICSIAKFFSWVSSCNPHTYPVKHIIIPICWVRKLTPSTMLFPDHRWLLMVRRWREV